MSLSNYLCLLVLCNKIIYTCSLIFIEVNKWNQHADSILNNEWYCFEICLYISIYIVSMIATANELHLITLKLISHQRLQQRCILRLKYFPLIFRANITRGLYTSITTTCCSVVCLSFRVPNNCAYCMWALNFESKIQSLYMKYLFSPKKIYLYLVYECG